MNSPVIKNKYSIMHALHRMYESRRILLPPMGERGKLTSTFAATLALVLLSVLFSLAWVQKSDIDYLRRSSGVAMFDSLNWQLQLPGAAQRIVTLSELGETVITQLHGEPFDLDLSLNHDTVREFMNDAGDASVVLNLPALEFERMEIKSSWLPERTIMRGEQPLLVFNNKMTNSVHAYELHLRIWPHNTQERVIRSSVNVVPLFLAVQTRFQKYQDFLTGRRTGSGKQLADIGRIVLAVFSVFLFLFIDSSPECLALGIFMSLKALAVVVGQGWLPDGMFAASLMDASRSFLLSFADFMQLYFFTQLARLWRPRPITWLAAGIFFGCIYTLGATTNPVPGGVNWPFQVWKWRNFIIGIGCLACSFPVAFVCWRAKLYHRATALLVASSGVLVQIITPMIVDIPGVTESNWYKTWYNLFETHTPYVFALSTFINVSTLERRVKTLSNAAIRKEAIERELTLGKAVQDAFFKIPELPEGLHMSYSHEAAEFVSGDTLYSSWDRIHNTVTMNLCDVTGHGVQAALKASICSAMSASIWEDGQLRPGDQPGMRLAIFYRRVTTFLTKTSGNAEILSMAGCELDLYSGTIQLFRANGLFPIIITKSGEHWVASTRGHKQEQFDMLPPGTADFVVLSSDGIMSGARVTKKLLDFMNAELSTCDRLTAESVKNMILSFAGLVETGDDKTMAVLDLQNFKPYKQLMKNAV